MRARTRRPTAARLPSALRSGTPLLHLLTAAYAAEVTDMAPARGGTASVAYDGSKGKARLAEEDVQIATRTATAHDLAVGIEVAPVDGIAFVLGFDAVAAWSMDFPDARPMLFEPVSGAGTYLIDDGVAPYTVSGGGFSGLWIGAAAAPWSETRNPNHRGSWRLDVAFRTGAPGASRWAGPIDDRGGAPGGSALRLSAAFSKAGKGGAPWTRVQLHRENGAQIDLTDASGAPLTLRAALRPATTLRLEGGVELAAWDDPAAGEHFAVDLHGEAAYRSWEDIGSGVLLPNTLDPGRSIPVTHSDGVWAGVGVALLGHLGPHARLRVGVDGRIETPGTQEHIYPVTSIGTPYTVLWSVSLQGRARLPEAREPEAVEVIPLD